MAMQGFPEPVEEGEVVRDIMGRTVGWVRAAAADSFAVDSARGAMRIRLEAIFTVYGGVVTLICDEAGLFRYLLNL
jgi:hypothetical protein